MFVIGLTGSIATGKTTLAKWFKELGIPVFNADVYVQELFESDREVFNFLKETWPHCVKDSMVDRKCLRNQILEESDALKKIEEVTHPKVKQAEEKFIKKYEQKGESVVVLDVPLLYESGQNELCSCVLLAYCSPEVQRKRAKNRDISEEMLDYLTSQQLPLPEKMSRADCKINTDGTLDETYNLLIEKISNIEHRFNVKILKD